MNTFLKIFLIQAALAAHPSRGAEAENDPKKEVEKTASTSPQEVQPTSQKGENGLSAFVDDKRTDQFIDSLGSLSRDAGRAERETKVGIKTVLDIRLPQIDRDCDIKTSHEMLRLGYAVRADYPGADKLLRKTAERLVSQTEKEKTFSGVGGGCRAALRSFGISILRIYLGEDWTGDGGLQAPVPVNK